MSGWLVLGVAAVAVLYAAVGHAGATGYIALMTLLGVDPACIRPTALSLNVVVAAIGTAQFLRAGYFDRRLFLPLAATSVPCAALGGWLALPTAAFESLLGIVLAAAAVRLAADSVRRGPATGGDDLPQSATRPAARPAALAAVGGAIGLLSGLTGVGGGVFLTPTLLALRAAPVKTIAAVTAAFILVNSLAGLAGGLVAGSMIPAPAFAVVAAAAAGGAIGSQVGAFRLPAQTIRILMAAVLAIASLKLLT